MSIKIALAVAVVALGLSGGRAFAEGEGNGDPFPFQAPATAVHGVAVANDTGSAQYPLFTTDRTGPSGLAQLEPSYGSEMLMQTANSVPVGGVDSVTYFARIHHHPALATVRTARNQAGSARRVI